MTPAQIAESRRIAVALRQCLSMEKAGLGVAVVALMTVAAEIGVRILKESDDVERDRDALLGAAGVVQDVFAGMLSTPERPHATAGASLLVM